MVTYCNAMYVLQQQHFMLVFYHVMVLLPTYNMIEGNTNVCMYTQLGKLWSTMPSIYSMYVHARFTVVCLCKKHIFVYVYVHTYHFICMYKGCKGLLSNKLHNKSTYLDVQLLFSAMFKFE